MRIKKLISLICFIINQNKYSSVRKIIVFDLKRLQALFQLPLHLQSVQSGVSPLQHYPVNFWLIKGSGFVEPVLYLRNINIMFTFEFCKPRWAFILNFQRNICNVSCNTPFSGNLSTILEINIRGSLPLRKSKKFKGYNCKSRTPLYSLRVPRNYEFSPFKKNI